MLTIDGNYLEGGGQIVRTSLALGILTQKAFKIEKIRSNRPSQGLKNQHLTGIRVLRDLTNSVIENAQLGSTEITVYPRPILKGTEVTIDIETAGSISLLLQSILLPCLFSGKKFTFTIKGGTDVKWSPQYDYTANVIFPHFLRYGAGTLSLKKRGYYPKGQGEVEVHLKKRYTPDQIKSKEITLKPFSLISQGTLVKIAGISHASADLDGIAERQTKAAIAQLQKWKVPIEIISNYNKTASTGSGITLWAIFTGNSQDADFIDPIRIGVDVLGEQGKRAETVGEECALQLNTAISTGSPIDKYCADHLIPLLGLIGGEIAVQEITNHTRTNIYVTEQFLDVKFQINEKLKTIKVIQVNLI
ncbi:MAG: RNA 3'-terminal phosphate cyclase [Candidatus Woesearchaeota archaeon]|jgi:RNA 3'-terminal phosphate cyclase (GTP)